MKVSKPDFREGIQWRPLPKTERPWKYKLLRDVCFHFAEPVAGGVYYLVDSTRILRGMIEPKCITVKAGYAWNGCSWSPDIELLASLPHDLLYQFSGVPGFPSMITRGFADRLFYAIRTTWLGWAYLAGLSIGSWAAWRQSSPGCIVRKEQ